MLRRSNTFGDDEENEGPRQVYFYPRDRRRLRILRCHAKTRGPDSSAVIGLFVRIVRETRRESGGTRATISGHRNYTHAHRVPWSKQTLLTKYSRLKYVITVRCSIANRHLRVPYPDLGPETACARWRGWRWAIKSRGGRRNVLLDFYKPLEHPIPVQPLCGGRSRGEISGKISEEKRRGEKRGRRRRISAAQ